MYFLKSLVAIWNLRNSLNSLFLYLKQQYLEPYITGNGTLEEIHPELLLKLLLIEFSGTNVTRKSKRKSKVMPIF